MPDRRTTIIVAVALAAFFIVGLVVPGKSGGSIVLLIAFILVGLTTATAQSGEVAFKPRDWALRVLVIMAVAAIGIVKLFSH